jgi:hypothetical protein
VNVCFCTGLVADWGRWYSPSLPYRRQTDAFLEGRLALSDSPTAVEHDMAWSEGGVEQVWGLGVPSWRLPFEGLARAFGQPAFPDRLALLAAIIVAGYVVMRGLSAPEVRSASDWIRQLRTNAAGPAASLLMLVFPPLMTLCRGPFNVYEEAVVYGYYLSIGIAVGTVVFVRQPSVLNYVAVSLAAGLIGFFRPPMIAYGTASVVIAAIFARRFCWPWRLVFVGPALFLLGGGLLFWTNAERFGSGFEFGHNLNLSSLDLMYLRFDAPYRAEGFWPAAKELFGSNFFVNHLSGFDVYREDIVAWQTPTPRWRHFYHTTFNASYLVVVVVFWAWSAQRLLKRSRCVMEDCRESCVLGAWSALAALPLVAFYLRFPAMSSRYMLDFAPAIAAAMAGGSIVVGRLLQRAPRRGGIYNASFISLLCLWWTYEILAADFSFPPTPVWTRAETVTALEASFPEFKGIPREYMSGKDATRYGITQNGRGWRPNGRTGSMVALFVEDPGRMTIELTAAEGAYEKETDYESIRAKVGLEFLALEDMRAAKLGKILTFAAPKRDKYRHGVQVVFLGMLPTARFLESESPFRLLKVSWENPPHD